MTSDSSENDSHCHSYRLAPDKQQDARNKLLFACVICLIFTGIEVVGGYYADSLAILTDAAHMLTDFGSFTISLLSLYMSWRPATKRLNFGWNRAEVFGAFVSVILIWILTGVLVYLAIRRIIHNDYEINAIYMLITATFGVVVNVIMGMVLHPAHHHHGHHHHPNSHDNLNSSPSSTPCGHHHHDRIAAQITQNKDRKLMFSQHHQEEGTPLIVGEEAAHSFEVNCTTEDICPSVGTKQLASSSTEKVPFDRFLSQDSLGGTDDDIEPLIKTKLNRDTLKIPRTTDSNATNESLNNSVFTPLLSSAPRTIATQASVVKRKRYQAISLAVRAAYIHVLGDLVQSFGILIAAFIIFYRPDLKIADPICTFVFSFFVLLTTVTILKDIIYILLEATPSDIKYEVVKDSLSKIPGVKGVHDLKIWALTSEKRLAIFHLVIDIPLTHIGDLQKCATLLLKDKFGIEAVNIQVEEHVKDMDDCQRCCKGFD